MFNKHFTAKRNNPQGDSIHDWDAETVRRAYQERYRIFWSPQEVRDFYASYPCYPISDGHEIKDDWGANITHTYPRFRNIRKGALEAYFDYQGSRVLDSSKSPYDYSFTYGTTGVFVMDLRTERRAYTPSRRAQIFSTSQYKRLDRFLLQNKDKHVILIVASVPIFHLPDWLSDMGAYFFGHAIDFPDHWSYHRNTYQRDGLLERIYKHQKENPRQKVIIVSGDVHIGCAFQIKWPRRKKFHLYQFTFSAISNRNKSKNAEKILELSPRKLTRKVNCLFGMEEVKLQLSPLTPIHGDNPFGGLNIGIIEIKRNDDSSTVTLK